MKKNGILMLACALALVAAPLTGCGGGKAQETTTTTVAATEATTTSAEDGKGDVIEEEPAGAEAFYGCWEYEGGFAWLVINEDGSYDWYNDEGYDHSGDYYMEGDELWLEDSDLGYSLDGDGLMDNDGDKLFAGEIPESDTEFSDPEEDYFTASGISLNYYLDDGDALLEDGAFYFAMGTEGQYYGTAPLEFSAYLESEEESMEGYTTRTVSIYQGISEEYVPMLETGLTSGCSYMLYDAYNGLLLPDTENFTDGYGDLYFEFETNEGTVDLYITPEVNKVEDAEGYHAVYETKLTITAPEWYDGLILSVPPQPETYEEKMDWIDYLNSLTEPVYDSETPFDLYNSLNCPLFA